MPLTRRDILKTPALLSFAADAVPAPDAWYGRPMRWGQLTLVEDDPPKLDVAYWLDFFKRCHCDAVTLSAGGVVAYYPTRVSMHIAARILAIATASASFATDARNSAWWWWRGWIRMRCTRTCIAHTRNGCRWTSRGASCITR